MTTSIHPGRSFPLSRLVQVKSPSRRHTRRIRPFLRVLAQNLTLRLLNLGLPEKTATLSFRTPSRRLSFGLQRAGLEAEVGRVLLTAGVGWRRDRRPWAERPAWHVAGSPDTVWRALQEASTAGSTLRVRAFTCPGAVRAQRYRALRRLLGPDFLSAHLPDPSLGPAMAEGGPAPAGARWVVYRSVGADPVSQRFALDAGVELSFGTAPTDTALIDFPIDAVYTWVDGTDRSWRAQHDRHPAAGALTAAADVAARFVQQDELRYSLRSLQEHAPWFRHIFIVTAGQRPSWLRDHPRITVVSHEEIWPDPADLPVFNSHAIEANLHRIPGLAEHYVYLNDDMFLGRPVSPESFFTLDGRSKVFPSRQPLSEGRPSPTDLGPDAAGKNNRDLVRRLTGETVTLKYQHAPYALTLSLVRELEAGAPDAFRRTSAARYRSRTDVSVSGALHHSYGLATGRAAVAALGYLYVELDRDVRGHSLQRLREDRSPDVFCLNAVTTVPSGDDLRELLDDYFPRPARWERTRV